METTTAAPPGQTVGPDAIRGPDGRDAENLQGRLNRRALKQEIPRTGWASNVVNRADKAVRMDMRNVESTVQVDAQPC